MKMFPVFRALCFSNALNRMDAGKSKGLALQPPEGYVTFDGCALKVVRAKRTDMPRYQRILIMLLYPSSFLFVALNIFSEKTRGYFEEISYRLPGADFVVMLVLGISVVLSLGFAIADTFKRKMSPKERGRWISFILFGGILAVPLYLLVYGFQPRDEGVRKLRLSDKTPYS